MLVKGRRNYLSLRRLDLALARSQSLFNDDEQLDQLRDIRKWSKGDRRRLAQRSRVQAARPGVGRSRERQRQLPGPPLPDVQPVLLLQDRRRAQHAQILVVNHALLFSDIALRRAGVSILPDYDVVILDEAHTVEARGQRPPGHQRHQRPGRVRAQQALQRPHEQGPARASRPAQGAAASRSLPPPGRHVLRRPLRLAHRTLPSSGRGRGRVAEQSAARPRTGHRRQPPQPRAWTFSRTQLKAAGKKLSEESEQQDFLAAHDRLMALAGESKCGARRPRRAPCTGSNRTKAAAARRGSRSPPRRSISAPRCASSFSTRCRPSS